MIDWSTDNIITTDNYDDKSHPKNEEKQFIEGSPSNYRQKITHFMRWVQKGTLSIWYQKNQRTQKSDHHQRNEKE